VTDGNLSALRELLEEPGAADGLDDEFEANVAAARESVAAGQDSDPWHD